MEDIGARFDFDKNPTLLFRRGKFHRQKSGDYLHVGSGMRIKSLC